MFLQGLCRISRDCLSHRGGHYGQYFKNQMQRKIAARLVELPLAQTATCSHLLRQPLAAICSGGHLQPPAATWQTLAATCSHLPKQPLGRHLQPLAATWQTLDKAATWQPLAATCSHLQPLGSHVLKQPLGSHLAATCSHSQTLAPSGCSKWLPGGLFFENPIAHLLRPQRKLINIKHVLNSLHAKISAAGQQQDSFAEQQVSVTMVFNAEAQQQGSARSLLTCKRLS